MSRRTQHGWIVSRSHLSRPKATRRSGPHHRRLRLEPLEDRRLLAVLLVNSDLDNTIAGDGLVTLREAIDAANAAGTLTDLGDVSDPGLDAIVFDLALDGSTIQVDNLLGTMSIKEDLTIDAGPLAVGLRIDAQHGFDQIPATFDGISIFNVDDGLAGPPISVEMIGLTLSGGDTPGEGGAIVNREVLKLTDFTITDNAALLAGGGVNSVGDLTLTLSEVSDNLSDVLGGGVSSIGNLTLDRSTVSGNMTPTGTGGGMLVTTSVGYLLSVNNSTISGNTAGINGGGMYLTTIFGGIVEINNSTVSANHADNDGGGIFNYMDAASIVRIQHSTITANESDADFNGVGFGGGISSTGAGAPSLDYTIVAANRGGAAPPSDVSGPAFGTFNLIGVDTGLVGIMHGVAGNMVGTALFPIDPMLGPLWNNGGPTQTHALLPLSPAINAGPAAFPGPPFEDQRGTPFVRLDPATLIIDIGAYERQDFGGPMAWVVDTLADENDGLYGPGDLSLREAIGLANGNVGFADFITFDPALAGGTIVLTRGGLGIRDNVTIDAAALGGGITIEAFDPSPVAGDGSRIFVVNDNDFFNHLAVELRGMNLIGADSPGDGGAIFNMEDLTLTGLRIMNNAAVGDGGGLFSIDGIVEINQSTISGNIAGSGGGGLYVITNFYGGLTINDSTISGNRAGDDGGGIVAFTDSPMVTLISNSTISGNRADGNGGGGSFFTGGPTTTRIEHSTITGNITNDDGVGGETGGGTYAFGPGAFEIDHTLIAPNFDGTGLTDDLVGITTATYSLIGLDTTGTIIDVVGNQIGMLGIAIDPMLDPLSNNGGPTLTHALRPLSPALDAGLPGFAGPPFEDERGAPFLRVDAFGPMFIDLGAYERQDIGGPQVWIVDTLADESDLDYGPGDLSLREAIGLANGNVGFDDVIEFDPALAGGTIELSRLLGELVVTEGIRIDAGALPGGVTIAAYDPTPGLKNGDGTRIFNINDNDPASFIHVELHSLTLTGGDVTGLGGAILSGEELTLAESIVTGNATSGRANFGGGIYSGGPLLSVTDSTISFNTTSGSLSLGGGIASTGDLYIADSTVSNNTVTGAPSAGGGIWASAALTITRTTVANNMAASPGAAGGGIEATSSAGPISIDSSTISGNIARGDGGGIRIGGSPVFSIDSSTISGNSADGDGGGVFFALAALVTSSINHSTITLNTADADGGGGGAQAGGGIATTTLIVGMLNINHTIIADNSVPVPAAAPEIKIGPIIGSLNANYSLVGDNVGSPLAEAQTPDANGNLIGNSAGAGVIDPMLNTLANNGGPTLSHKPMIGSPAIAAGDPAFSSPPFFDQRGAPFLRKVGAAIDIGAIEVESGLLGDYNQNHAVDAADYTVWRDTLTAGGSFLPNDPTPGVVDNSDFLYWRAHFGDLLGVGAGAGAAGAVNEEQAASEAQSEPSPSVSVQVVAPQSKAPLTGNTILATTTIEQSNGVHAELRSSTVSAVSNDVDYGGRVESRHVRHRQSEFRTHRVSAASHHDQLLLAWLSERDFRRRDQDAGDSLTSWSPQDKESSTNTFCNLADQVFEDLGLGIDRL